MSTAIEVVDRFVAELVRRFEPERVILFGQLVDGSPRAFAEVGLLVEMEFEGLARDQAARIAREVPHDFSLDLLVRRPSDLIRAVEIGNRFLTGIVERGRVLYARPGTEARPARASKQGEKASLASRGTPGEEMLQEIVRRIVEAVRPEQIVLFGSAVRGEMGPDSDLDFLVVKRCADRHETATTVYRGLRGIAVPIDVVVVTPEDVERHKDIIGYILRPALREGRVVYAA